MWNRELHETRDRTERTDRERRQRPLVLRSPLGVPMLIEDFFATVDRAFMEEAGRIRPRRLELATPPELPLSAPESSASAPSLDWRRPPKRCRMPERRNHGITFR
jgi:hypothetical protein